MIISQCACISRTHCSRQGQLQVRSEAHAGGVQAKVPVLRHDDIGDGPAFRSLLLVPGRERPSILEVRQVPEIHEIHHGEAGEALLQHVRRDARAAHGEREHQAAPGAQVPARRLRNTIFHGRR